MTASLSPSPKLQFNTATGAPLVGGLLFTYFAGTTSKATTYTDSTGETPNTNPIVLDSRGECNCWLTDGEAYKFVLSNPGDSDPPTNPIWTVDGILSAGSGSGPTVATTIASVSGALNIPYGGSRMIVQVVLHESIEDVALLDFPENGWNLLLEVVQPAGQEYEVTWPTGGWYSPGGPKPQITNNQLGAAAVTDLISVIPGVTGNIYISSAGQNQIGGD